MKPDARLRRLTELAEHAFDKGQHERALRLFAAAEQEAQQTGDYQLVDRAFCNRCALQLDLDPLDLGLGELQRVLLRSQDPFTGWMAAHSIAEAYKARGELERAQTYAGRASALAPESGDLRAVALSANQLGRLAAKRSEFLAAREHFAEAHAVTVEYELRQDLQAIVLDNLGYSLMCTGQHGRGFALCRQAAVVLESVGGEYYLAEVYQDLCYASLHRQDYDAARAFGDQALALARRFAEKSVECNTLLLLADGALDQGDRDASRSYLDLLTTRHPEAAPAEEVLRLLSVRDMLNLMG